MEQKARLGRGLDALLGATTTTNQPSPTQINAQSIDANPFQPRKTFDDDELASLGESIKNHGVLQPLVVRKMGDRFQLIAGERRLRAAQQIGIENVPVTIVDFNDQQVLEAALVENIQRTDLNPIEKAQGFKDYLARFKLTHDQLARRLGLARSSITNLVSLLDLAVPVQEMIRQGQISTGHAKILKSVKSHEKQIELAREVVARGLSVHALDALLKEPEVSTESPEKTAPVEKTPHVLAIEDELRQKLSTKIEIKVKSKDKGSIVVNFDTTEDFERIVSQLRK